jgi:protein-S-isoprenylcysteine O-methyltransferase Ste14
MNSEYLQLTSLSIFTLILLARYAASLARGLRPVLLLKKEKSLKARAVEALPVAAVGLNALLILRKVFTPHIAPLLAGGFTPPPSLQFLGFALSFLSFFVLVPAYWALGDNWRVGTGDEAVRELVTGGVFAYTRNPVYLFFHLFLGGKFLINGDIIMLVLLGIVTAGLHRVTLEEERLLEARFGGPYREYRQAVPRYLPLGNPLARRVGRDG